MTTEEQKAVVAVMISAYNEGLWLGRSRSKVNMKVRPSDFADWLKRWSKQNPELYNLLIKQPDNDK